MKRALLALLVLSATAAGFTASAGQEVPALKPGLWEMRSQSSGANSPLPMTVCVGAMSEQQRQLERDNIKNRCSKYDSREVDGKWVIDAVCSAHGQNVTKHSVISLSGDSFREENSAQQGGTTRNMTSDGKWLGPCKPGQKPDTFK